MPPTSTSNGIPGTLPNTQDQLIDSSVATATLAVNSRLESLITRVSSQSTGDDNLDQTLDGLRENIQTLVLTQASEQEEIKKLLADALNAEVLQHLTREIEAQIDTCIEATVAGLVEEELKKFIPRELRQDVDKQKAEMHQLQVNIHNAEARRSNSFIKTQKQFGETLQHLISEERGRCEFFPKTVRELLALNDAKVVELVEFFGKVNPDPKAKVQNLNWFLTKIGVTYQSNFLG